MENLNRTPSEENLKPTLIQLVHNSPLYEAHIFVDNSDVCKYRVCFAYNPENSDSRQKTLLAVREYARSISFSNKILPIQDQISQDY